ncbi:hypothetical protein EV421DRAFT_1738159 [Armillaria borealis]|uniref:Uncharacterized protein n=1 Tax=Armillaria borealis TaxID=47425 RepID=A0AA39JAC0_9AGAR|nr:hypothetical protein EV421DRAFT_1738159 [Armillaria borealis]
MNTTLQSLKIRKMSEDGSLAAYIRVVYLVFIVYIASSQRCSNGLWPIYKPAAHGFSPLMEELLVLPPRTQEDDRRRKLPEWLPSISVSFCLATCLVEETTMNCTAASGLSAGADTLKLGIDIQLPHLMTFHNESDPWEARHRNGGNSDREMVVGDQCSINIGSTIASLLLPP